MDYCVQLYSHSKTRRKNPFKGGQKLMLKKISTIPFTDTPEQAAKLDAVIAECTGDVSMLMHVMQVYA